MAVENGTAVLIVVCFFLLLMWAEETLQQEESLVPSVLQPPPGNSLVLKARTQNGKLMYECSVKNWVVVGATADLVMASNPSVPVGTYTSQMLYRHGKAVPLSTWTMDNSAGYEAESGNSHSSVSGKEVADVSSHGGSTISEALLQATSHQFDGSASLISYIQRLFPQGGASPLQNICELEATSVEVPFEVEFWFWRQDLWPPAVPATLSVSGDEQPLQGFFATGFITYRYSGSAWILIQAEASLYNVPGGVLAGNVFVQAPVQVAANEKIPVAAAGVGSNYWLHLDDPNGFKAVGQPQSTPLSVDGSSMPWSLVKITSYSSNNSGLWNCTHVQIVATRGGLPTHKAHFEPVQGMTLRSPFSALFWFYVKSGGN